MQLSQRSDDSPKDKDDQDHGYCLLVNKSPGSPLVCSTRISNAISQKATTATSSGFVSTPLRAPLDVTPPPRAPRQPSVFIPATPSQNRILREDIFGSSDTDLSDPSDDSEADSMKALSQKIAARSDPLITVTKHASVLADAVFSVGPSGKRAVKRRVLDSGDEKVLSSSRKGAEGSSKSGVDKAQKAPPPLVVPDTADDIPPALATSKSKSSRISLKLIVRLSLPKKRGPNLLGSTLYLSLRSRNHSSAIRMLQRGREKRITMMSKLGETLMSKKTHPL